MKCLQHIESFEMRRLARAQSAAFNSPDHQVIPITLQDNECFEMGRFARAQRASFNSLDYQATPTFIDVKIDLDIKQEKCISSADSDLFISDFLLLEEKESRLELDVNCDCGIMEMEEEESAFRINTSPTYKQRRSYSIPYVLNTEKKKKKLKKLIGKLSRERRSAENTKIKLQRRRLFPFAQAKSQLHTEEFGGMENGLHIMDYQDTPRSCLALV
jgi:hypothetical protein